MKMPSVLIPATFAVVLAFGVIPTPAGAEYYGHGYYRHHGYGSHNHWNGYSNQNYRQWHQYGGNSGQW